MALIVFTVMTLVIHSTNGDIVALKSPIEIEKFDQLTRPTDLAMSERGDLYVIDKEQSSVYVFDGRGRRVEAIERDDLNMVPRAITTVPKGFWVGSPTTGEIFVFRENRFVASLQLEQPLAPFNLITVGDRVVVANYGTSEELGGVEVRDFSGNLVSSFVPDVDFSEREKVNHVWSTVRLTPVGSDRFLAGYLFEPRAFVIDLDGDVRHGADLSRFAQSREHIDASGMSMPKGFVVSDVAAMANGSIVLSFCDRVRRSCGRVIVLDAEMGRSLQLVSFDAHIKRLCIRQSVWAVITGTSEIRLYDFE